MTFLTTSSKNIFFNSTRLSLVVDHSEPKCPVKILDYCIQDQVHSKGFKFQLMSEPFATKLGMVMYHDPECHMKMLFSRSRWDLYTQNMPLFFSISSELLIFLHPLLVWYQIFKTRLNVSLIFRVSLISLISNWVCWCVTRPNANKVDLVTYSKQ